jgi:hypothetical protein
MNDFIIHLDDYGKSLKGMSNEEVGELIKAMIAHIEGEEVEISSPTVNAVFPIMSGRMDRDLAYRKKASEYGKKGGAPIGNTNAKNKGNTRVIQGSDKGKQTPNPNPNPKPNINKRQYGECANVYLTDEEYEKVKSEGLTGLIDELSYYIAAKGDKYKSHYAVIRQWANRRKKETKVIPMSGENAKNSFNRFSQRSDNDYDYSKLIKN